MCRNEQEIDQGKGKNSQQQVVMHGELVLWSTVFTDSSFVSSVTISGKIGGVGIKFLWKCGCHNTHTTRGCDTPAWQWRFDTHQLTSCITSCRLIYNTYCTYLCTLSAPPRHLASLWRVKYQKQSKVKSSSGSVAFLPYPFWKKTISHKNKVFAKWLDLLLHVVVQEQLGPKGNFFFPSISVTT